MRLQQSSESASKNHSPMNDGSSGTQPKQAANKPSWKYFWPFILLHLGCIFVFEVGFSWIALFSCLFLYVLRMFAITGFYHRYFSHRAFKTSRLFQFIMAVIGNASIQKGPLWWAAHHRDHHRYSDKLKDLHSPIQKGFWYSHIGWITVEGNLKTRHENVPDLCKYPELVLLDSFDWVIPLLYAGLIYLIGSYLQHLWPEGQTSGPQLLIWGGFLSSVLLFHATCTINSLSHVFGNQRYQTGDSSRNNFFLSLITLGEGWHNNHHHYPGSVRHGFFWWEIDMTFYILKLLECFGIVWDLHPVPQSVKRPTAIALSDYSRAMTESISIEGTS
jgi:stearoyl-CoA desaturase (delta-9 desaturase)